MPDTRHGFTVQVGLAECLNDRTAMTGTVPKSNNVHAHSLATLKVIHPIVLGPQLGQKLFQRVVLFHNRP
ncbi:hypothetical protein Q7L38_25850, partial [Pseudomonas protegens]|uniref:hypothetical protein n=1 Tax=Pseudomonas protegens TaxID=380021 RepID=UPI00276CA508